MALTKPTLLSTEPFDSAKEHIFSFTSSGGSTNIVANKLTIQRNDTLAIVYDEEQTTFAYQHVLPANTLTNGIIYQASIYTIGADGSQSVSSTPILFYCLATPTFEFTNIPSGGLITNNSYSFEVLYNQTNGEMLNTVTYNLYGASGALLSTSGTLNNFNTIPANIVYLFSGFENNVEYAIEAVGQTVNGMSISTGRFNLIVNYQDESVYSKVTLTNNCDGGYITVQSTVVSIDGTSNPSPPTYINDSAVDLRQSGSWVEYPSGYEASGNFTAKLWGEQFTVDTELFRMSTVAGATISLLYKTYDNKNVYAELVVVTSNNTYVIDSDEIAIPSSDHEIYIMFRRINNIYEIELKDLGVSA